MSLFQGCLYRGVPPYAIDNCASSSLHSNLMVDFGLSGCSVVSQFTQNIVCAIGLKAAIDAILYLVCLLP